MLYNQPDNVPKVEIESKVSDNDNQDKQENEPETIDLEELALSDPVAYEKFLEQSGN